MTTRSYIGIVVYEQPGQNSKPTQPVWAPVHMKDEDWCEYDEGCCPPKRECVICKLSVSERIRRGIVCGTCADEGETTCNCWEVFNNQ